MSFSRDNGSFVACSFVGRRSVLCWNGCVLLVPHKRVHGQVYGTSVFRRCTKGNNQFRGDSADKHHQVGRGLSKEALVHRLNSWGTFDSQLLYVIDVDLLSLSWARQTRAVDRKTGHFVVFPRTTTKPTCKHQELYNYLMKQAQAPPIRHLQWRTMLSVGTSPGLSNPPQPVYTQSPVSDDGETRGRSALFEIPTFYLHSVVSSRCPLK
ncbi:uncharacterized protein LOC117611860 [Osmia lignaria lignaria]|uniref:uncharacterized protein LOC117611860 n=1 Tax=Osmia lignaria lignaria TaxID=1437193 RepID=UPI00402B3D33